MFLYLPAFPETWVCPGDTNSEEDAVFPLMACAVGPGALSLPIQYFSQPNNVLLPFTKAQDLQGSVNTRSPTLLPESAGLLLTPLIYWWNLFLVRRLPSYPTPGIFLSDFYVHMDELGLSQAPELLFSRTIFLLSTYSARGRP